MKFFVEHPRQVGETYSEHFIMASGFGLSLIIAGLACFFHGFFPFMFKKTGSNLIKKLHDQMVLNRSSINNGSNTAD